MSGAPATAVKPAAEPAKVAPPKSVRVVDAGRSVMVQVEGPMDLAQSSQFLDRMRPLSQGCQRLIVDLRRADFIDSSGVRALLVLQERLAAHQGELRLVINSGSRVERTLKLLQLQDRLAFYYSAADAWGHRQPA
jgi:anti-anti-sigma factor